MTEEAAPKRPKRPTGRPNGRPPTHRRKLDRVGIDWVCDRLLEGWSQRRIADEVGIVIPTLIKWVQADPARATLWRQARTASAEIFSEMAEQAVCAIPKDATKSEIIKGVELARHYRWLAGKRDQVGFGPRQTVVGDKDNPIQVSSAIDISTLTDNQIDALISRLQRRGNGDDGAGE
jgi:hypothetical protein